MPERSFNLAGFLLHWVINAAALGVAAFLIPGIEVDDAGGLLLGALIFGFVNALIKPIVQFVTCPLIVVTLGLFTLIINAVMMGITSWFADLFDIGFHVDGFAAAFMGAIVVSIVSWVLTQFTE